VNPPATLAPLAHRADIEGLRGVAVLSVFAVHSVPHALGGGFIGVDVFFALSGYLVASITLRQLDQGRFSMLDFYGRRVRRLAPALLVVLLACALFAAGWAYPSDAKAIGRHLSAGSVFGSNLLLWTEGGYFDRSAERKLLLHLWSLGIEAQFYLLWPIGVLLLVRSRRHALGWIGGAALGSFVLNVALVAAKPKGVFFLPPTRFWELLMGSLLACLQHGNVGDLIARLQRASTALPAMRALQSRLPDALAWAGFSLLLCALWFVDNTRLFPGWWALLPTTGTLLLIVAGPSAWINRKVLLQPVLTFYGRISYPLYLWHWPVLVAPLLLEIEVTPLQKAALLCLAVALATATYYAVEQPLRVGVLARLSPAWLVGGLGTILAAGFALQIPTLLVQRYPLALRAVAQVDLDTDYAQYRVEHCFLRSEQGPSNFGPECVDAARGKRPLPLLLLWGDSHAAALYPGLLDQTSAHWRLAQFNAAACPPGWPQATEQNPHCAEVNQHVLELAARLRPDRVVLAANWVPRDGRHDAIRSRESLRRTVAALREIGVLEIVLVGPLPRWRVSPSRVLLGSSETPLEPLRNISDLDISEIETDARMAAEARELGVAYASPLAALCNGSGCLLSVIEGRQIQAIAFDSTHLSAAGSRALVAALPALTR
jgi:peptidoglycan/LPS O-acetylase OafA/YrhL